MFQQPEPVSPALIVRMDADGAEGPGGFPSAVRQDQFGLGKHHMADQAPVLFHHEIQFRDEVGVAAIAVQYIMLRASGAIDIPEGLPGEFFHGAVVGRRFKSDLHGIHGFTCKMMRSGTVTALSPACSSA